MASDLLHDSLDGQHMLTVCTAPDCHTVVFGVGTCVEHDRRPAPPVAPEPLAAPRVAAPA